MEVENEENALLERIFLRIVLADSDERFEESIAKFLPVILNKSGSPFESIRTKVLELLSHILKRVRATRYAQLPVEQLLTLYKNPKASPFIVNFSIIYIKLGFPRLPQNKKWELLPVLIEAAKNKPLQHQESLCLLVLVNLKGYQYPKDDKERLKLFGLKENLAIQKLLLEIALDILLLPYGVNLSTILEVPMQSNISQYGLLRLTKDELLDLSSDYLEQLKISVIQFLGVLGTTEVYPHLVIGTADSRSIVIDVAENQMKRIETVDYDNINIVKPLYSLYMCGGDGDKKVSNLDPRIRLKLLAQMAKFRVVPWPTSIQVLFESLYGHYTSPKLKQSALMYASCVIKQLAIKHLDQVWQTILHSGLIKLLDLEDGTDKKTKLLAYPLISSLVLRCSDKAKKQLNVVEFIFGKIESEMDVDLRAAARDCAVAMAKGYKNLDPEIELPLRQFLVSKLQNFKRAGVPAKMVHAARGLEFEGLKATRSAAVRFLTEALTQDADKVFMLLQATVCGDEDTSVEAKKSLYTSRIGKKGEKVASGYVLFRDILEVVIKKDHELKHEVNLLNEAVIYLRLCLANDAIPEVEPENLVHPCDETPLIRQFLLKFNSSNPGLINSYTELLIRAVHGSPGSVSLSAVLEILGCLPEVVSPLLQPKFSLFSGLVEHVREDVRLLAAEITSHLVLTQENGNDYMEKAIAAVNSPSISKEYEKVHGSVALAGHLGSRFGVKCPEQVKAIAKHTDHASLGATALSSLSLMPRLKPLPLSSEDYLELVNKLIDFLLDLKSSPKIKERSCSALAAFCASKDFPHTQHVLDKMINAPKQIKDVHLCLSSGDLLVVCILGLCSSLTLDPWLRSTEQGDSLKVQAAQNANIQETASLVLERLLDTMRTDRHPATRQTLCFWLLAITKHCGHLPVVETKLPEIQNGFIDLLADRNGLVQEGAGKGLALVYEATKDNRAKQEVLKAVVEQLTVGRKSAIKVSDETTLFQEGELGESPTGGKLSTYKELCQLASDLKQPDLIYKFMELANHNAVWNSKKGAAYTISSLMSKAGSMLEDHLPKILVKLYRYQFDPVPHIQQSMSGVWSSLASPDTVLKYHKEIFDELLANLTNPHYRVRISCSAALQDFMRGTAGGKIIEECPEKLAELWSQLFRVMDDVHEGAREAATSTAKTLSKICIRECKKEKGKSGQKVAGIVLPVILDKGIKSRVSEVRSISIATMADTVKEGLSKTDAPLVVVSLLRSCADLGLANIYVPGTSGAEALDKLRVPMIKSNHIVQALVQCVPQIDAEILPQIHSELVDLLKPSAGFGTRIVASHFIVLLSHHLTIEEFQPYIGKLLGGLLSGLSDKSPGIRRQYASCLGQILRCAKDTSVVKVVERLRSLYFDKEDEQIRQTICLALQACNTYSQDSLRDKQDLTLPLIFFAKHVQLLPDKSNHKEVEEWNDLWADMAYGPSAMSSNEQAIVETLEMALRSQSWKAKAQTARAAKVLGLREDFSGERRLQLANLLLSTLPGRTWNGKEDVLHALAGLVKYPESIAGTETEVLMIEALMKECKKERTSYKVNALGALGQIIESLGTDRFELVHPLLKEIYDQVNKKDDKSDEEDKGEKSNLSCKFSLLETAYDTLARVWPSHVPTQERYIEEIVGSALEKLEVSTAQVQCAIVSCLFKMMDKSKELIKNGDPSQVSKVVSNLYQVLDYSLGLPKNTRLKKEALNLLQLLQLAFKGRNEEEYQKLWTLFEKYESTLAKDSAPEIKSRFTDIRDLFKTESMLA
ncbi:Proteasome-associated protein ECM29 homolog [Nesidiocoris tenuis]|uniref:Proteasome-associated protein ECM29 homolog n=1 Tax=Nesidiocoris tenuis TaxID=355587 RepID=A0ABN7B5R1_9HEMI|nr:Proteasome-associated protein ECM29 homolog [Nesidiocoris tenuis]